jgi:hypothetical protein
MSPSIDHTLAVHGASVQLLASAEFKVFKCGK